LGEANGRGEMGIKHCAVKRIGLGSGFVIVKKPVNPVDVRFANPDTAAGG
jgi:hypothetical protein